MSATFTPSEAADALNVTVEDLRFWRTVGLGPAYIEIGPVLVRYTTVSLDSWARGQLQEEPNVCCPHCGASLNEVQNHDT